MSYLKIPNLYKSQDILLFRECYAMEKIHGTSAHLRWSGDAVGLTYFSGGCKHDLFRSIFNHNELEIKLKVVLASQPAIIYGEAYGGKIMGMSKVYGEQTRFVAFEVKIGDMWLAVPAAHQFVTSIGLEFVHYSHIAADLPSINVERDADSIQAARNGMGSHIREGVILRPLLELRKNNGDRIIAKHKRSEFRETKEQRYVEVDPAKLQVLRDAEAIADEWVTAQRLEHVLSKLPQGEWTDKRTGEVIRAMIADVLAEGAGEIVDSQAARKAIGTKTAAMYLRISQT